MHTPDYTITPEFRDGDLMYVARVAGREVGAAYSYVGAEELAAPRYELMLDVSAGDPEEQDGPSEEGGEGGPSEPPDIYRRVPDGECASCYHFGPRVDDGEAYVCADFDMCCERGRADTWSRSLAGHVAREYTAFLAAAPIAPASSPLQPAPAGGDAANAAGLEACRVCGEMHAPPSEVCDVNGCGRGPVGVYWFGIPGRCYPARLCSAHGTVVA